MTIIVCEECQKEFRARNKTQLFCSAKCSYINDRNNRGVYNLHLSTNAMGAFVELLVCQDLMVRGYEVFRCVSPSASFDLVAYKKSTKETLRIEVRTGMKNKSGSYYVNSKGDYDMLAGYMKNTNELIYFKNTQPIQL